jgi:hypothetical protein
LTNIEQCRQQHRHKFLFGIKGKWNLKFPGIKRTIGDSREIAEKEHEES